MKFYNVKYFFLNVALLLTGFTILTSCQAKLTAQKVSNNSIYIPANIEKDVMDAVEDMKYWLEKVGIKNIEIIQYTVVPDQGIRLAKAEDSNLPNLTKSLLEKDGQSFHLKTNGVNDAIITGTGKNSFVNGIYTFLQEIGFRWYMPGENWVKLGDAKKSISINKVYTPDFADRFYFGSGGAHPIPGIDEQDNFSKEVILWNRRNRISHDYEGKGGHAGMAFYASKKDELDIHPEYFCYGKINKNGRFNIDNKSAVNLFVSWALEQRRPNINFQVIGVDPADGSGGIDDCLPINIKEVKTWSDKYFWLANQVAEKLPADDNRTRVQLYAYNQHAAPPHFDLYKNVYPVIIPYAFQNVATPSELIEAWRKKMKNRPMGIYDYWNITQWSKCLPQFNIYTIQEKLRLWKRNNITSINLESTWAKGPMGHAFWIATQMMWNTDLSFEGLYNEFLNNCFGNATNDIKRMYDRWSLRYQGAMEADLSGYDLQSASEKVDNNEQLQRIEELKAYVHYIKLYEEYQGKITEKGYNELLNYIYSIHHFGLLHTSALSELYIPKPKGYKPVTDKKIIALANSKIKKLDYADIEKNFHNDMQGLPDPYSFSSIKFDIRNARPITGKEKKTNPLFINNGNTYRFFIKEADQIELQAGATKDTRILIKDKEGKIWLDDTVKASKEEYKKYKVHIPMGEYALIFGAQLRFSRLILPENIVFFSEDHNYDNAGFPWHYLYVPKDVSEIVYNDNLGPGINDRGFWLNPEGEKIEPQKIGNNVYKIVIPEAERGKVWVLNIGHRQFKMLNIPDIYSLNIFEYDEK